MDDDPRSLSPDDGGDRLWAGIKRELRARRRRDRRRAATALSAGAMALAGAAILAASLLTTQDAPERDLRAELGRYLAAEIDYTLDLVGGDRLLDSVSGYDLVPHPDGADAGILDGLYDFENGAEDASGAGFALGDTALD